MRTLVGHTKDVRAVTYLSDGRLVSGGSDRTVRVWNPATGEILHTVKSAAPVYAVAIDPQGRTIAYAGRHPGADADSVSIDTFHLPEWNAGVHFRFPYSGRHPRSVWSLSFSADGKTLAAAGRVMGGGNFSNGGGGHWFRTDDRSIHGSLGSRTAFALRFAPVGETLAVTSMAQVAFYATPEAAEPVVAYKLPSNWAAAVAFLHGTPQAVVGVNAWLYVVDATAKKKPRKMKTGFRTVTAVAAASGGHVVVGGKPDGVEVYDPESGTLKARFDFGLGGVHAVDVAPDGLTFAVGGDDGLAVFDWDA